MNIKVYTLVILRGTLIVDTIKSCQMEIIWVNKYEIVVELPTKTSSLYYTQQ